LNKLLKTLKTVINSALASSARRFFTAKQGKICLPAGFLGKFLIYTRERKHFPRLRGLFAVMLRQA